MSVVSPGAIDLFFPGRLDASPLHQASSLGEIRTILDALEDATGPRSLDLIAHSRRTAGYVMIFGDDLLDMMNPRVERFFAKLATDRVLPRLGITAVRLLGCETAVEPTGQRTMQRLARVLAMPVYGSRKPLTASHYTPTGFDPAFVSTLVESSDLPTPLRRLAR